MTLAIACLTPEFVTLVADRRLSNGSPILYDDLATKVVVVCNRGAIAYSGLSRCPVPGRPLYEWETWEPMDTWIVRTLAAHNVGSLSEAARVLRIEATKVFEKFLGSPSQRRHAFMLAGWSVGIDSTKPVIVSVSNALDDQWEWRGEADDEFQQRTFVAQDPRKFHVSSIGAAIPARLLADLRRWLRRGFRRGIGPASVLRLSVRAIRGAADGDASIGKQLLGVCVPPCQQQPFSFVIGGGPMPHAITFLDFKVPEDFGTMRGPHFVCGGSGATGFKVGNL